MLEGTLPIVLKDPPCCAALNNFQNFDVFEVHDGDIELVVCFKHLCEMLAQKSILNKASNHLCNSEQKV